MCVCAVCFCLWQCVSIRVVAKCLSGCLCEGGWRCPPRLALSSVVWRKPVHLLLQARAVILPVLALSLSINCDLSNRYNSTFLQELSKPADLLLWVKWFILHTTVWYLDPDVVICRLFVFWRQNLEVNGCAVSLRSVSHYGLRVVVFTATCLYHTFQRFCIQWFTCSC